MFQCYIINAMCNTIAKNYYCFKLDTEAMAKKITKLLKNDHFMLSGPVNTLPFTIPN